MSLQTQDVIHALDCLEPNIQQLHQFDWSSGHAKGREGGLLISNMNYGYGGSGGKSLRDTELSDGCVGDAPAVIFEVQVDESRTYHLRQPVQTEGVKIIKHNCRVYSGDVQSMSFGGKECQPLPPFLNVSAPYEDTICTDVNGKVVCTGKGTPKTLKGYARKAKGIAQILWERGLYRSTMKMTLEFDHPDYPDDSASFVLGNCEDFKEEISAMEEVVQEKTAI